MQTFNTLEDIKQAVDNNQAVKWVNNSYNVTKDRLGQYLVTCKYNNSCVGLTHRETGLLVDNVNQFYIKH